MLKTAKKIPVLERTMRHSGQNKTHREIQAF
jgi:hypothetical protein